MVGVAARRSIEQIEKTSTIRPFNISQFEFSQNNSKQTRKARRTICTERNWRSPWTESHFRKKKKPALFQGHQSAGKTSVRFRVCFFNGVLQ
jgi:hypothetical protein